MTENQSIRPQPASDPLGLKPGEIFWNNYRVISVIGKGGVSTVYKAENLQNKQYVAIKLLHAQKTRDVELVRRFIREAQTTTRLDHPHAIHIWEWGIDEGERPFMIIEYLSGETLAKRIQKSNGLNFNKALDIMEQVCAAIQEAHALGIIHRDLKPDNIMLTTHQGVDDWVKVCDFGIARLEPDATEETGMVTPATLTATGAILGTPMYMSPEQLRGRKADARSDIYSLGCIMYEMLTGKPPFNSKNTAEIVVGHLNQTPELPHRVRMDLSIPESLGTETMRALAKNPWERPTTVAEFIASLRRSVEKAPKSDLVLKDSGKDAVSVAVAPTPYGMVSTPTPYGMVADPMRRVCPRCKAVASGGNLKFCLKCGQDNLGKWLPYHSAETKKGKRSAASRRKVSPARLTAIVLIGAVLCWMGYAWLSKPIALTGRFVGKLDHQLFDSSDLPPVLGRMLRCSRIEMLLSEEGQVVHGLVKTPFGEDDISGKIDENNPMVVSYDLESKVKKMHGKLEMVINGSYIKLLGIYNWRLRASFEGYGVKPITDTAGITISPLKD